MLSDAVSSCGLCNMQGLHFNFRGFLEINSFIIIMAMHNQQQRLYNYAAHINGLMQKWRNSNASALELRLSCTNPSIWYLKWMGYSHIYRQSLWRAHTPSKWTTTENISLRIMCTLHVLLHSVVVLIETLSPTIRQDSPTVAELFD